MNFLQRVCIFCIILLSNDLAFAAFSPEKKAEAIRLVREGNNFAEVAREINTSPGNIRNWIRAEEQRTGQQIAPLRQNFIPEKKAEAIRLVREGNNFAEVAREINTSPVNVRNWLRAEEQRTGQQIVPLQRRQQRQDFTPEQKAEAIRLVREGKNFVEVAREINTSRENVRNWIRAEEQRTGQKIVPLRQRQDFTPEQKAEAIRLVREGKNVSEVAREINTSLENVRSWIRAEEQRTGQQIVPLQQQQHFTPEQKAEAIRLVREGKNFSDVAREINTSPENVRNWIRAEEQRTGQQIVPLQRRQQRQDFTSEQKAEAIRLVKEGKNVSDVAREINTSPDNVRSWIRAEEQRTGQQIVPLRQHFTPEQKAEAIRLVREGNNFAEVAREINTSRENVRSWIRAEEQRTGQQIVPLRQRQDFTPEQKAEAIRLVREGKNFSDVAREINTSPDNVRNWIRAEKVCTSNLN